MKQCSMRYICIVCCLVYCGGVDGDAATHHFLQPMISNDTFVLRQRYGGEDISCADDPRFTDAYNYGCAAWQIYRTHHDPLSTNCSAPSSLGQVSYSEEDIREINEKCPFSCGVCAIADAEDEGYTLEHVITVPEIRSENANFPLLLYFHGWGGSSSECDAVCRVAAMEEGYMVAALTGMGETPSWKGFGSTSSPGPEGSICKVDTSPNECYVRDCGANVCANVSDGCWWTTCYDSVGQVLEILDALRAIFRIDSERIFATGCSNGAMFLYELADDPRSAPLLAGIAPVVGLPHRGFNHGPSVVPMHFIGFFGASDATVPPINNVDFDPYTSVDTAYDGWYYSTSENTTRQWVAKSKEHLDDVVNVTVIDDANEWIGAHADDVDRCTQWTVRGGNSSNNASVVDIVECLFNAGHVCQRVYQYRAMFDFFRTRSRILFDPQSTDDSPSYTHAFEHGVASGDPTADSIVLWSRLTPRYASNGSAVLSSSVNDECSSANAEGISLRIVEVIGDGVVTSSPFDDDNSGTIAFEASDLDALCDRDWTIKLDVTGLRRGVRYAYAFAYDGAVSSVGYFKLFDEERQTSLRFAVFSCASLGYGYFRAYRHAANVTDLDFWMQVGDYIYDYDPTYPPYIVRTDSDDLLSSGDRVDTLDDYRRRYDVYHRDEDLQSLRAAAPLIAGWDDHEFANDAWIDGAAAHDDGVDGPWSDRKRSAALAYEEWLPIRPTHYALERRSLRRKTVDASDVGIGSDDAPRYNIERVFDFGRLMRLVMVESRATGRSNPYTDGFGWGENLNKIRAILEATPGADTSLDSWTETTHASLASLALEAEVHAKQENRTIYGAAQIDWIASQLEDSPTVWQIIGQQQVVQPCFQPNVSEYLDTSSSSSSTWTEILRNATTRSLSESPSLEVVSPFHGFDAKRGDADAVSTSLRRNYLSYLAAGMYSIRLNFDGWQGYESERRRLLDTLRQSSKEKIVVLGGDSHNSWAGMLRTYYGDDTNVAAEFDGPGTTSPGMEKNFRHYPSDMLSAAYVRRNAATGMAYANASGKGYMVFEVDASRLRAEYVYVDVAAADVVLDACVAFDYTSANVGIERASACRVGIDSDEESGTESGPIAAVVVVSLLIVLVILGGVFLRCRRRERSCSFASLFRTRYAQLDEPSSEKPRSHRIGQEGRHHSSDVVPMVSICRHVTYGIDLEKFDDVETYCATLAQKIRAQPGVKKLDISICGTGRVGATYEFTNLASFKAFMGSEFYKDVVDHFKEQSFYDAEKEPTEFVGVYQPNI
eukprot:g535.t1